MRMLTRYRQVTILAVLITVLMLGITSAYWYIKQKERSDNHQQAFNESADQIQNIINQRLTNFELMLRGVKGLFEGSGFVDQTEYRNYINALSLQQTLLGLQAVAIALHIPHDARARYLADMHQRGLPDFHIKPAGIRDTYVPISLIEPYSGSNLNAMGFDLNSNPLLMPSLLQARDTGQMALTRKMTLIQDAGTAIPAAVMYVPIYNNTMPLNTVEERRKAILAWVSGPFRIRDLIASLENQLDKDIGIEIYDGSVMSAETHLYGSGVKSSNLQTLRLINIGGRQWTLAIYALPAFDARFPEETQSQIVAGGVTLSLLIGLMIWLLGTGRARAEMLAYEMTQELRATKADLECTLNAMPDIMFELDLEGRYYHFHTSQELLLALPAHQILGKKVSEVLPPEAAETCLSALQEANEKGMSLGRQIEIPFGQEMRWFELSVARKDSGEIDSPRFVMISRDITERLHAGSQLRIAAIAFESQEGMMVTDASSKILRVNQSFTKITGYSAEEVIGEYPNILNSGRQDQHFYASMWDSVNYNGSWSGEIWNKRKSGEVYPEHLTITAVKDANGIITNYVATMTDITESKAALDEINLLAFYDPLTHLPNRRLLIDRLNQALASSARSKQKGALLFLDLDHFKTLNDTLGHDTGDMLLQQVAERLTSCVRDGDTIARLGGDEFVVLLEDLGDEALAAASRVEAVAYKILQLLSQTYQLGSHQCHSTISIGAVLFGEHHSEIDDLLKQADIAMYEAKSAGRNTLRFFDPKMQSAITARAELELELRKAIELQQFKLYYQVQVDVIGQPIGAEALIRWEHPERGLISPVNFIPLAEETGLILPIGKWVLEAACAQLKQWEQSRSARHLRLSVNVSARQFHEPDFVEHVESVVSRFAIDPSLLNFELTESMLLDDIHGMIANMNRLKQIGIRFELDDFGTGYSSMQYLKQLPLYQLKIDQSFVRDIADDGNDRTLVSTIISMAHSLSLQVIAEGVETEEQMEFLKGNGCYHYQGYYFSKPLPIEQFEALLKA